MPSLTKIFSFAAVAFAAFASAAPTPAPMENSLIARDCACAEPGVPSLVGIVAQLKADIDVDVKALAAVKVDTCTVEHIKPIVVSLVGKIDVAATAIVQLGKYKADQIFFDGNVVVDIKVFAELLVSVIVSICAALEVCLRIVVNVKGDVHALLCLVGVAVARLLHCICGVVGDLLGELLAILCIKLQVCFSVFVKLNLVDLYALLKINVRAFISL